MTTRNRIAAALRRGLACGLASGVVAGLAIAVIARPTPSFASGAYTARPPQPGASGIADRAKYSLGQRVFNGKVKLEASEDAAAQRAQLEKLQAALPGGVAAEKDLVAMAGRLSKKQLAALEYFVDQRYPQSDSK
jgi:hypothetical protein